LTLVLEHPAVSRSTSVGRPMDVTQFMRIAVPLAGALRKMHDRGLIHKDVKAANVLVDLARGGVWLTGFGIASRLPRASGPGAARGDRRNARLYGAGTDRWMNRLVDSRSDLYALGVTSTRC